MIEAVRAPFPIACYSNISAIPWQIPLPLVFFLAVCLSLY